MQCYNCKKEARHNSKWCEGCLSNMRKASKKYKQKRKDNGLCYLCGEPVDAQISCESCRKKKRESRIKLRDLVLTNYGNMCACCGESERAFLAIDHINNDGAKHRKELSPSGVNSCSDNLTRWIVKNDFPNTVQILCHNCNMGKMIMGVCPHKIKKAA